MASCSEAGFPIPGLRHETGRPTYLSWPRPHPADPCRRRVCLTSRVRRPDLRESAWRRRDAQGSVAPRPPTSSPPAAFLWRSRPRCVTRCAAAWRRGTVGAVAARGERQARCHNRQGRLLGRGRLGTDRRGDRRLLAGFGPLVGVAVVFWGRHNRQDGTPAGLRPPWDRPPREQTTLGRVWAVGRGRRGILGPYVGIAGSAVASGISVGIAPTSGPAVVVAGAQCLGTVPRGSHIYDYMHK